MTPDVIARVFEPFFTTKPIGQGTGLGLSMLYGFIKQSNGHVRIASEPGQGTVFRLYLPRGEPPEAAASAARDEAGLAGPSGAGRPVLVVEDEHAVRLLIVETLQELGYLVLEAVDGQAGLAVIHSAAAIDLLITDVGLPGLNGRQLADAARARRRACQCCSFGVCRQCRGGEWGAGSGDADPDEAVRDGGAGCEAARDGAGKVSTSF